MLAKVAFQMAVCAALLASPSAPVVGASIDLMELCSSQRSDDCVQDGDTFKWRGERVRIENIDAPELDDAKCMSEAKLAITAAGRLLELMNQRGWQLVRNPAEKRNKDGYGRLLRRVVVGDRDLGEVLVSEGLARPWTGRREPWC